MNLPTLIQQLYGRLTLTGLYSFEFVTTNRSTITEIFFMMPPKTKTTSESTRSTTNPTLSGNYNTDAGNSTKEFTLSGDLYFNYVGSPDNPIAPSPETLDNTIDGLNEFFKLRWMLIRYRDYTMTKKARMTIPTTVMNLSPEISALYSAVAKRVSQKAGALYDEIQLIFHDYDMDDHYYCRVDNFTSNQSGEKYGSISYTINLELYEPDNMQTALQVTQLRRTSNEEVDTTNRLLQDLNFSASFDAIQTEIGYNSDFISSSVNIENTIDDIDTENDDIQAGKTTVSTDLPVLVSNLIAAVEESQSLYISLFLSQTQQALYETGDLSIDEVVSIDMMSFYNTLQKVLTMATSIKGTLASVVKEEEIRYYANADDFRLTTDQFDNEDESKVETEITFYYYTVMEGDTARQVALRELHDSELFINILKANDILENDFLDSSLVGTKIKIPINTSSVSRSADNLVYETDQSNIEKFLYGTDIATGINKEILISSNGDILGLEGVENVFQNVELRVSNRKGSFGVFSPDMGTVAIDDSNAPNLVKISRYLTDLIGQMQADPRVESVKMDIKRLEYDGETISVPSKLYFIGTEETREVQA